MRTTENTYRFLRTDSSNEDFRSLVTLLDRDLSDRDGNDHAFYAQFNGIATLKHSIVAYDHDKPIGSGAFKEWKAGSMEVKRMYVLPEYRVVASHYEYWQNWNDGLPLLDTIPVYLKQAKDSRKQLLCTKKRVTGGFRITASMKAWKIVVASKKNCR